MDLTKEYFDSHLERLNNRMDGFVTKEDLLDLATKQDISSLKTTVDDIQEKVTRIDKRTDEDIKAVIKDIINRTYALSQVQGICRGFLES